MQFLRHVYLRSLENALGDTEGDAVDEEALPEGDRGGRRLLEPGEVVEVVAEGPPALPLELDRLLTRAPE